MADLDWQSALDGLALDDAAIAIGETDRRTMIDLRILPQDTGTKSAVAAALGFELPQTPRTSTTKDRISALWLSIDHWLIVSPHKRGAAWPAALVRATSGGHGAATDLSDARACIRLEGTGAREIIMKGGAADLLGADFSVGSVRRLNFASVAALVHYCSADPDGLDLYVMRSFADYTIRWLKIASRPGAAIQLFGPAPAPPV